MADVQTSQTGTEARPLIPPAGVAVIALLGAAIVALFFRWFRFQHLWSSRHVEDWGHSYVIPLISAYMIWLSRDRLSKLSPTTFWPGLIPVLFGIVSYFTWSVGPMGNHMLQGFSLITVVFGVTLTVLGPGHMRYLFLPIVYLAFGVTLSTQIMNELTWQLKILASKGSYISLSAISMVAGFGVTIEGNHLTVITPSGAERLLNIAEACSGMRMVIAFVALAGAVALIACREWWQRFALLLLAVPVALLMNVVRVTVLGLASLRDADLAGGDAHMFIGTVLLLPALGLFMLVIWALNRIVAEPSA